MAEDLPKKILPKWHYHGVEPSSQRDGRKGTIYPPLDGPDSFNLGDYARLEVSNLTAPSLSQDKFVDDKTTETLGRAYFDLGLRLLFSYQHEIAAHCFLACLEYCPYAVLAHGLVALCHSPNYNFKGQAYYDSACHAEDLNKHDLDCIFPSQHVADRHSCMAMEKVEEIRKLYTGKGSGKSGKGRKGKNRSNHNKLPASAKVKSQADTKHVTTNGDATTATTAPSLIPDMISDVEVQLLNAIRILTCAPGIDSDLSQEIVGRPFANAMRKVCEKYPTDADVVYFLAESIMVLNAWKLYEYPSGKPVSPDVIETKQLLEDALVVHPQHAGLCHMYVHLSEMSSNPAHALTACEPLRHNFPHAGHLVHMPTHIDVLVGNYESCVRYNRKAIAADHFAMRQSPSTAGKQSFYFGYIVHDYHMAVYGAILGGMEGQAMELAHELNTIVNEDMFREFPDLASYLESYSALDVHTLVRFGRWEAILELEPPQDKKLMLYRAASVRFARALALAAMGQLAEARKESDRFETLRRDPEGEMRILHNNSVADLLAVDAVMLKGEIAYRERKFDTAFKLLRKAVKMQDDLNYDEPWGKMQPIRHALGGLLLEQKQTEEATKVFREDLKYHPQNPWALVGLIRCLKTESSACCKSDASQAEEIHKLEEQLRVQRSSEWADYEVVVACECCEHAVSDT